MGILMETSMNTSWTWEDKPWRMKISHNRWLEHHSVSYQGQMELLPWQPQKMQDCNQQLDWRRRLPRSIQILQPRRQILQIQSKRSRTKENHSTNQTGLCTGIKTALWESDWNSAYQPTFLLLWSQWSESNNLDREISWRTRNILCKSLYRTKQYLWCLNKTSDNSGTTGTDQFEKRRKKSRKRAER